MISELFENLDYLSLIGVTLVIYVTLYYYKYFNRVNPIPGPLPYPFFGNLPQLYIWHGENLKNFMESNHKKYGDLFEFYLDARTIGLNRPEHIEKLFSASPKNPYIRTDSNNGGKGYQELGIWEKGIFHNQDFTSWKFNRNFFTQTTLSPKFPNEATHLVNKVFDELESYWDKLYLNKENRKEMDIYTWLLLFTNDMILASLTGERSYSLAEYFNELSDNEKAQRPSALIDEPTKYVNAIRKHALGVLTFQFVSPFLRHYFPYFKNKSDDLLQNADHISQKMETIMKRRRQEIENTPLDKPLPNDMLTLLITANTPRGVNYGGELSRPLTDSEARVILLDGIVAGTDTVSKFLVLFY
jgi:cytochrome P450